MTHHEDSIVPWQAAAAFAARAHQHQVRKDSCTPYFSHPCRVALTLSQVFGCQDDEVIAAALLHDVIEDTTADYDDILESFGERVADLVAALTKDMRLIEEMREPAYDDQLKAGPREARLIKLADVFDNLSDSLASGRLLKSLIDKAVRAVALAEHDPELADARAIVASLIEQARAAAAR
ncbi:MAG: HD domain-containing protein [Phycisphaerales bacterium]